MSKFYGKERARRSQARSICPRAHDSRHRISHRRRHRGETRHPAQLDSTRARRRAVYPRTHVRRGPRSIRRSNISKASSAPRSRWNPTSRTTRECTRRQRRGDCRRGRRSHRDLPRAPARGRSERRHANRGIERRPRDKQGPHRSRGRGCDQIVGARTFNRTKERASMRPGEPRHRHHRRSRHRQDDSAALAAGRTRGRRIEADTGRTDRTRSSPAPGGLGPRRENYPSSARIRSPERWIHPRQEFSAAHKLSDHRRGLDDGRRARLEPALRPDAELLAVARRRSRSASFRRSGQRAQGRDRFRLRARGAVEGSLSAGAPQPDRRQRASTESGESSRNSPTTPKATSFSSSATPPRMCSRRSSSSCNSG